ncbi:MAG: T9SS type A sorting domain-containing protein, partial [Ignavibacteriota bacterium]
NPPNYWNPRTRANFCNMTVVGPQSDTAQVVNPLFGRGAHIRRNTELSIYNSVVMGWPLGLVLDGAGVVNAEKNDTAQIRNSIWGGLKFGSAFTSTVSGVDVTGWYRTPSFGNSDFVQPAEVKLTAPFNQSSPNFTPTAGSPALSGASFSNPRLTNAFFEPVSYRGAFGSGPRWDSVWTNYDPQNTIYAPKPVLGETSIVFPTVKPGTTTDSTVMAVIRNTGNVVLQVSSWGLSDATVFSIVGGTAPFTVKAGGSKQVVIRFNPSVAGNFTSKLHFDFVTKEQTLEVALSGAASSNGVDDNERSGISLFQNSPNPVNGGMTNISYSLKEPGFVTLDLLDITGNTIGVLANSFQTEGLHSIRLNTSGLSDGLYLYRLNVAGYSFTKRLVVVK